MQLLVALPVFFSRAPSSLLAPQEFPHVTQSFSSPLFSGDQISQQRLPPPEGLSFLLCVVSVGSGLCLLCKLRYSKHTMLVLRQGQILSLRVFV